MPRKIDNPVVEVMACYDGKTEDRVASGAFGMGHGWDRLVANVKADGGNVRVRLQKHPSIGWCWDDYLSAHAEWLIEWNGR